MRHLLSISDLNRAEIERLFNRAADLKANLKRGQAATPLVGRSLALVFEKPSLRTRVTFQVAMTQLGGQALYLSAQEIQLGLRESVPDVARNLGRWVDAVAARTYAHATVEELAAWAGIPVINALSDREHPCQALADFFTLWERGIDLRSLRFVWIGDGNNVCHSLMLLTALLGVPIVIATPPGHEPDQDIQTLARSLGGRIDLTHDPKEAAVGADVLYTDVWISMGQEAEREERLETFRRYQLNERLVGFAKPGALIMHCLPAHRNEEITDALLDGPQSIVFDQAENRLHVQKAVLLSLLGAHDV